LELGHGERVICEGDNQGDRIVFTNKRVFVLDFQQPANWKEIRHPRYKYRVGYPLESIREVYTKAGGFISSPKMITELNDGTKLECDFKTSGNWQYLFLDIETATALMGVNKTAVIDRSVNAVRDAVNEARSLKRERLNVTHEKVPLVERVPVAERVPVLEKVPVIGEVPMIETVPMTDITDVKYCRYCGNKNPSDSLFCEKCGKKIG